MLLSPKKIMLDVDEFHKWTNNITEICAKFRQASNSVEEAMRYFIDRFGSLGAGLETLLGQDVTNKWSLKPIFHLATLFARTDKKVGTLATCSRQIFLPANINQSRCRILVFASRRANKVAKWKIGFKGFRFDLFWVEFELVLGQTLKQFNHCLIMVKNGSLHGVTLTCIIIHGRQYMSSAMLIMERR